MLKNRKLLLLLFCFILVGCWNKKEINDVAIVIGVGIDKTEDQYSLTAQVVKPQQEMKGGEELSTWSITNSDKTMGEAINGLNEISPRLLYWPHLQIIIFHEEVAKEGIGRTIDWFMRDQGSRAGAYVVISKGKAEDLLNQTIELGDMPARSMASFIETAHLRRIPLNKVKLNDLASILSTPGIDPTIDVISFKEIRGKIETYELKETAVFSKDQFIGYLGMENDDAIQMGNNTYERGNLAIKCSDEGPAKLTFRVTDFVNKTKIVFQNQTPFYEMDILLEGNINDQACATDLTDEKKIKEIENIINEEIKKMIRTTFEKTVNYNSDVFGIGKEIRRKNPSYWKKIQDEKNFYLKDVQLQVKVNANIRRTGLIIDPTSKKINNKS